MKFILYNKNSIITYYIMRCTFIDRLFTCFSDKKQVPIMESFIDIDVDINKEKDKEKEKDINKEKKLIEYHDTCPFIPPVSGGQVIKVYDGDTITIAAKLPYDASPLYRFQVRLNGIDCPEIKSHNEDEKSVARIAKDEVIKLIMNKQVILKNVNTEKYGRILADVYVDDIHINAWLVNTRLAVKYDGGTKISPKSWGLYHLTGKL